LAVSRESGAAVLSERFHESPTPKHSEYAAAQRAFAEGHAHAENSLQKLAAMLLTDERLVVFC
jgi:hypothetical protein